MTERSEGMDVPLERRVGRRPSEEAARGAIEAWLSEYAPGAEAEYSLCEDGYEDSAPNKCGWAFWVVADDTTSYVHEDLTIEWYGTSFELPNAGNQRR